MKRNIKTLICLMLIMVITMGTVACTSKKDDNDKEVDSSDITASVDIENEEDVENEENDATTNSKISDAPTVDAKTYTGPTKIIKKYVAVTDKKGKTKTKLVTEVVEDTDVATTKKAGGKSTTKAKKTTTKKNQTTTEPTTHYTTLPEDHNLPEDSFDGYMYTISSALSVLQYYYGDEYVVNYYPEKEKGDNYVYAIFKAKDKYTIYFEVTVNLLNGKMVQKEVKTGKKIEISLQ